VAFESFDVPTSMEEYHAVQGVLEEILYQTISSSLVEGQTLLSVEVTSIGGVTGAGLCSCILQSVEVQFEMKLAQEVSQDSSTSSQDIDSDLYDKVTQKVVEDGAGGDFASKLLQVNAESNTDASSSASVTVQTPVFADLVISPTHHPTTPTGGVGGESPTAADTTTMTTSSKVPAETGSSAKWYADWVSEDQSCKNNGHAPSTS
jgi:hypothetical protein